MKICNEIQQKIAELDFNARIDDKATLQHIASCQACQDYQLACEEMDQAMCGMSDYDAEDALVESTLSSILSLQEQSQTQKQTKV